MAGPAVPLCRTVINAISSPPPCPPSLPHSLISSPPPCPPSLLHSLIQSIHRIDTCSRHCLGANSIDANDFYGGDLSDDEPAARAESMRKATIGLSRGRHPSLASLGTGTLHWPLYRQRHSLLFSGYDSQWRGGRVPFRRHAAHLLGIHEPGSECWMYDRLEGSSARAERRGRETKRVDNRKMRTLLLPVRKSSHRTLLHVRTSA